MKGMGVIKSGTWAIIKASLPGRVVAGSPVVPRAPESSRKRGNTVTTFKSDKQRAEELTERLNRHPEFRDKVEELLDIVDNKSGDANKADDAEDLIWEELREMGQRALQDWAERKQERVVAESENRKELSKKEKKGSTGTRR
jgi:hypothetical protein